MELTSITSLLGSAAVGALVTAVFSKVASDKNVRIENITKERTKWRETMRDLVAQTSAAFVARDKKKLIEIKAALMVRLNPGDTVDEEIIKCIDALPRGWYRHNLDQFNLRVAGLLKHDWERVKIESSRVIWPPTFAVCTMAVTASVALVVWVIRRKDMIDWTVLSVFEVGAVLVAIYLLAWGLNWLLNKCAKKQLDNNRTADWLDTWKSVT